MQFKRGFFTAFVGSLLMACTTPTRILKHEYEAKTDEYVNVSSGEPAGLRAGQREDVEVSFTEPMEEVFGSINGKIIKMKPDSSRKKWSAMRLRIPAYADLPEKFMRIYGKDLTGDSLVGTDKERMPGSWLRIGDDGKFPDVPGDNFTRIPIVDWK